jgi:hypothetical protein
VRVDHLAQLRVGGVQNRSAESRVSETQVRDVAGLTHAFSNRNPVDAAPRHLFRLFHVKSHSNAHKRHNNNIRAERLRALEDVAQQRLLPLAFIAFLLRLRVAWLPEVHVPKGTCIKTISTRFPL